MTESVMRDGASATAGALLRAARERQGLHIAALAAMLKIPQRKLEALEADRYDELPDATFTRAVALTVCRALKVDAAPVLAQLPQLGSKKLADVPGGLNAPYRHVSGRTEPERRGPLRHPLSWAALLILAAAAIVLLLPAGWWRTLGTDTAAVPAADAAASAATVIVQEAQQAASAVASEAVAEADAAASAPTVEVVHSVPADPGEVAASAADATAGLAVLRASEASWVEVVDAAGQVLVRRALQPGEILGLDGQLPFKLRIGNAAATRLQFRGQDVDLGSVTRDNVARLELK